MDTLKKLIAISILTLTLPFCTFAATSTSATTNDTPANTKTSVNNHQDEVLDAVAAVVNDEVITLDEVNSQMESMKQKFLMSGQDIPDDNVIRKQVVEMMVNKKLQTQIAERSHIDIEVDDINAAVSRIAEGNHMTLEQMRAALEKEGITYKQFRKELKEQLMLQKVQQHSLAGKITVTDQEADDLLKKMSTEHVDGAPVLYHLANILIALPESPTSAQTQRAQAKAQAILDELKQGTPFNKVAAKQSDSDQALDGGDMGWRKFAEIPTLFATEIKTMKQGDVRGPIRAPNGLHILKFLGKKAGGEMPSVEQVKNMIYQRKMTEQVAQWLQELRDESYVKTYI